MKINKVNILEKESTFSWEELFFSYTNSQGIVEGGNEVFRRVSKYEWIEIINKPHNIIMT